MERKRLIKLTPKSHKGKNRVNENGDLWEVIQEGILLNHVMVNIPGDNDRMFIRPIENENETGDALWKNVRWIKMENDPDFEWSEFSD